MFESFEHLSYYQLQEENRKHTSKRSIPKMPRQTVKTQIWLLLMKPSDQGLPYLLFDQHFIWEQKEKSIWNFRIFTVLLIAWRKTESIPKRPRQTVQTQIRLLLMKHSDQGLPFLTSILSISTLITHSIENRKRKVFEIFKHLLYY